MRLIGGGIAAFLLLAACSSGHAASGSSAVTTTAGRAKSPPSTVDLIAPAVTKVDPTLTVLPNRNLVNGQRIVVKVSGFGVGGKVRLSECATAKDATDAGCGPKLTAQTLLITDKAGAGSASFVVQDPAPVQKNDSAHKQGCGSACVVVATFGSGGGYVFTPLAFAH